MIGYVYLAGLPLALVVIAYLLVRYDDEPEAVLASYPLQWMAMVFLWPLCVVMAVGWVLTIPAVRLAQRRRRVAQDGGEAS